jgi:hypothetical protein
MIIGDFELLIAGPPLHGEELTCEIYYHDEFVAEISHESNEFILEIYKSPKTKCWTFSLEEFQKVLEKTKNHLGN